MPKSLYACMCVSQRLSACFIHLLVFRLEILRHPAGMTQVNLCRCQSTLVFHTTPFAPSDCTPV